MMQDLNFTMIPQVLHILFLAMFETVFQAAKIKGCEKLVQWIEPVRNHFWHCAETCDGDTDTLKVSYFVMCWLTYGVYCTVLHVVGT